MKREKIRIFVDMDGTLAEWRQSSYEELFTKGFFRSMTPQTSVVEAIKLLQEHHDDQLEIYTLSAVLPDSLYALSEKNEWLNEHLPEIDPAHRLFVACGNDKRSSVPHGVRSTDILLDDYTQNLIPWAKTGRGLKLMNGVNGTKGTWTQARVTCAQPAAQLAESIYAFATST